jgi:hypothetical protein
MGPLTLAPPVDERISALARRTARMGEKILVSNGARVDANRIVIPLEPVRALAPELFRLSDLTKWWNPDWKLERAGFGGAGGGIRGIRGNTYLDGEVLSVWPRDEVRGALLRRTMHVGYIHELTFDAGADPGSVWRLLVFVDNQKLIDREINGGSLPLAGVPAERRWESISVDLSPFENQEVVIRLYDLVLVPHQYAGNSYWRRLVVH